MDHGIFQTLLIIFSLAIAVHLILRTVKLPVILGYLVIGMIAGPEGAGWLEDTPLVATIAELGLVFLLFRIGLEFSLAKLWEMRSSVFAFGGLQVVLSILGSLIVGWLLKVQAIHSFVIGSVIALSSTAVVSKKLAENKELSTQYGRDMIAVLLMQDLLVVPILFTLPMLRDVVTFSGLLSIAGVSVVKGAILVCLMYVLGRFVFKPIFRFTAKTNSEELFTLITLFVVLIASWLSQQFKMSMTLGSFMAGMLLSETAYRHKILTEIRPFQDIFLGMFFVTVGMQFSFAVAAQYSFWFFTMMVGLLVCKGGLIFILGRLLKRDNLNSFITASRLAHGGEFGFAILAICSRYQLMPENYIQVVLEGLLISLVIGALINFFMKDLVKYFNKDNNKLLDVTDTDISVVLCGYGQVGSELGTVLQDNKVSFYAIDSNLRCVENAIKKGHPVYFADASLNEIRYVIEEAQPKLIVICFRDEDKVYRAINEIRGAGYTGEVIARTSTTDQAEYLQRLGISTTMPEISSTVYSVLERLLVTLDHDEETIHSILDNYIQNAMVM